MKEQIELMRREYTDVLKSSIKDRDKYLESWGNCVRKWGETIEVTRELLEVFNDTMRKNGDTQ